MKINSSLKTHRHQQNKQTPLQSQEPQTAESADIEGIQLLELHVFYMYFT